MISTYEIEKKRHELMLKNARGEADAKEFVDAFLEASVMAAEYKESRDALLESINKTVTKEVADEIIGEADLLASEYDYRFVSKENIAKLEEYGYTKPIVPVDYEEAMEYMDDGYPVFLLNKDGTEKVAGMGFDVERHIKDGGMVGVLQFAAEDKETSFLEDVLGSDEKK